MRKNVYFATIKMDIPAGLDVAGVRDMLGELIGEAKSACDIYVGKTVPDEYDSVAESAQRVLDTDFMIGNIEYSHDVGTDLDCRVDVDRAIYLGDGNDGVYYQVFKDHDGSYYVSTLVDCDTGSFCDALVTADGPYDSYSDAASAGLKDASDWCMLNGIDVDDQYDGLRRMIGR